MRRAFAALAITACALNTMPKSEACREVLGSCADAVSKCCAGGTTCGAVPACSAMAQQMCASETGDVDSGQVQSCLAALDNYTCSASRYPTPLYGSDAEACLAMY